MTTCEFKPGDRVKHCKMFLDRLANSSIIRSELDLRIRRRGTVTHIRYVAGGDWWDVTVDWDGEGRLTYMEMNIKKLGPGEL